MSIETTELEKQAYAGFSCLRVSYSIALASAACYYAPSLSEINSRFPSLALGILSVLFIKDYVLPAVSTFCYIGPSMSIRRKVMISTWTAPSSGEIFAKLNLDVTEALKFIEAMKAEGKRITLTHIVIKAIGKALKAAPSVNGRIVFGRFVPFDSVDISCLVNLENGKDLAMARISDVDKKDVFEIADAVNQQAGKLHDGRDEDYNKAKGTMRILPTGILCHSLATVGWLASALGLNMPALGVKRFNFGGAMVSSVGAMGIDSAYIPFTPWARVPLVICIGAVCDQAAVEADPRTGDKRVSVRPMLTLSATMDHRFLDGAQGAVMFREVRAAFANPEAAMLAPKPP